MPRLIKTWEELDGLESENYVIRVEENCRGLIRPKIETNETRQNFSKHHSYLSTHTFYGSQYKGSTKLLQHFGFDVEIDNWDKEESE